jgi:hypothetical protein
MRSQVFVCGALDASRAREDLTPCRAGGRHLAKSGAYSRGGDIFKRIADQNRRLPLVR